MNAHVPSRQLLRYLGFISTASRPLTALPQSNLTCCSGRAYTTRQLLKRAKQTTLHPTPFSSARPLTTTPPTQSDVPSHPLPNIVNHYTIFPSTLPSGPPPHGPFDIPLSQLRREFLLLQSRHHPDKYPDEPAHSKSLALSALINEAYKTLSDTLLRAQYILLHNYDIDVMSEDNSSHTTDHATLLEVMESQEQIEEATDHAQIAKLMEENAVRIEETTEKMAAAFEADDVESAKNECVRLKYWRSLQDGLKDWEPGKEVRLIH